MKQHPQLISSFVTLSAALSLGALIACGSSNGGDDGSGSPRGGSNPSSSGGSGATSANSGGSLSLGGTASDPGPTAPEGGAGPGGACVAAEASAAIEPVYLSFAFDVSGSMGDDDEEYGDDHRRDLKWDPVVAATSSFFSDASSSRMQATLTFFPIDAGEDERCDPGNYAEPDVALTALPSPAFAAALADMEPDRGGTPTLAVVEGVIGQAQALVEQYPTAKHVLVLVSDGKPQSCDDNDIASIETAVSAVVDKIPTYVIGVANPSGDENVTALDRIAVAGGTQQAYIVATGDPEATKTAFRKAVDAIRGSSISCNVPLPAPPQGKTLDPRKVNVSYTSTEPTGLVYSADCSLPGSWRYDDPAAPTRLELCPDTCQTVLADPKAELSVGFGCTTITEPPR